MLTIPLVLLLTMRAGVPAQAPPAVECADARACRQLALEAADRQDHELFHDLAWRAVQKAGKPEPELMYLLARAQALSGRPGDALVMLSRLLDMKAPVDVATNDDFRRVRSLRGWPDLLARIEALSAPPIAHPEAATPPSGGWKSEPPEPSKKPAANEKPKLAAEAMAAPASGSVAPAGRAPTSPSPATARAAASAEVLRFDPGTLVPGGLAYDGVSRRFIVADRRGRRLAVVDEFSTHVATMAGAQAGFGDIKGMEIDAREGHLWVVSNGSDTDARLHKLQLISGRVLATYALPAESAPARLVDVAVGESGVVLVLDAAKGRIFRLSPGASALALATDLGAGDPSSIAPGPEAVAYVARQGDLARVDLRTRTVTTLRPSVQVDLAGVKRLRWTRGGLVGIQQAGDRYRAVHLALDPTGRLITGVEVLDPGFATTDPTAAALAGGSLYYLAGDGAGVSVKKVTLPEGAARKP